MHLVNTITLIEQVLIKKVNFFVTTSFGPYLVMPSKIFIYAFDYGDKLLHMLVSCSIPIDMPAIFSLSSQNSFLI